MNNLEEPVETPEEMNIDYYFRYNSFSDGSLQEISDFLSNQRKQIKTKLDAGKHAFSIVSSGELVLKNMHHADPDNSFFVTAINGGKVVGLRIILIDRNNEVVDVFNGVDYDHTKKGIATELVKKTHEVMKRIGITHYSSSLQPYSLNAIAKVVGNQNVRVIENHGKRLDCEITIP